MAVRWLRRFSGSARGRVLLAHGDRCVNAVVCAQFLWQPRVDPAPPRNQLTSPMRVAARVLGRTRRQYERVVCDARLQAPGSGFRIPGIPPRHATAHTGRVGWSCRFAGGIRACHKATPASHGGHASPIERHKSICARPQARRHGRPARWPGTWRGDRWPHLPRPARWPRAWRGDRWPHLQRPARWPGAWRGAMWSHHGRWARWPGRCRNGG